MFSLPRYGLAGEEEYSPADSFHHDLDIPDFHPGDQRGVAKVTNNYTATAIPFIYSFSGNSAASAAISTFMCP
jgi:hypothetical protein